MRRDLYPTARRRLRYHNRPELHLRRRKLHGCMRPGQLLVDGAAIVQLHILVHLRGSHVASSELEPPYVGVAHPPVYISLFHHRPDDVAPVGVHPISVFTSVAVVADHVVHDSSHLCVVQQSVFTVLRAVAVELGYGQWKVHSSIHECVWFADVECCANGDDRRCCRHGRRGRSRSRVRCCLRRVIGVVRRDICARSHCINQVVLYWHDVGAM
ncbi:hypothetical protein C8T65DRAFT_167065 [Cerioporus squamosus]|nr:hypothetical protein C8T65DRAFT_167065 [Cerioporus squamosus]